ncbi:MAG: efflux RND transporter periplasmic adaptor subunit, partial [Muribaculaceae bacterium]|nr:efflux RND transporter periplasmic adaptor subunit [Muribaculaceae bacterium]
MKNILYTAALTLFITGCNSTPDFDATGIFEATTVTVSAETAGKLLSVNVNEGDTIMTGSNIAVIDTSILVLQQKQLMTQRSATESSSPDVAAQAAALRARIANQQRECDRFSRLLADGATTQKQYDDAMSQLTVLKSELTALLSTLGKNRNSISDNAVAIQYQTEQIEDQITKSIINSPLTGTILEKYVEPGEFATPGRAICKIADLNKMYLRAYFTVGHLANIKLV